MDDPWNNLALAIIFSSGAASAEAALAAATAPLIGPPGEDVYSNNHPLVGPCLGDAIGLDALVRLVSLAP